MDIKTKLLLALAGGYKKIRDNVLLPLLARVGTFVTAWLVMQGAPHELAQQVATGVVAIGLIIFDLMISWMNRKEAARKAVLEAKGVRP